MRTLSIRGIDLNKLQMKIDKQLSSETKESLLEWFKNKRKDNAVKNKND